ncbi:MAG: hypothetical protein COW11_02440 [Candidatus Omnitrophica bacterium CG12_big_fil_rev_8_21_14_0_65_43_15]|uniref:DUF2062 domain-containing protein n=1 Tax=Candidatus Taenaricola geysiri TaxID=1974752 RepID=A0A2J0LRY1_9BACT|nr:MAG: hypothetical protein COW11_02440 [Candidatus Omnitrophica bacterium CG12_big_fil_rev_8_21_14_0_65_43_15]PIY84921.1 MAG: hypothetical protein COY77_00195 [Candidatus Omnitrophica bacterium CG_4_10_14_0_8_um_filter_43_18]
MIKLIRMRIRYYLNNIYNKLVKANDTPHRIALGFGIGVFYGLFPFVGVVFTIITSLIFKANKASALIGCFVTNTWMTALLLLPSIKVGSKMFGVDWRAVWQDMRLKDFSSDVLLPSIVGFLTIALAVGVLGYLISLFFIIKYRKHRGQNYAEDIRS